MGLWRMRMVCGIQEFFFFIEIKEISSTMHDILTNILIKQDCEIS